MNILFVSTSIPFPARQGVELPLQHIIERFANRHSVDLLVITKSEKDREDFVARRQNIPSAVRHIGMVQTYCRTLADAMLREVIGLAPTFLLDRYDTGELRRVVADRYYDVVWVSPIGCIGFVHACRRLGVELSDKIAIGHNDSTVSLYWDGFKQAFRGRAAMEWRRILQGMRVPWIWIYERRYLRQANLVHLQTPLECRRAAQVLGRRGRGTQLVDAPNGRKVELEAVRYRGKGTKRVLFMTHLARGRRKESLWFLNQVWPRVLRAVSDAQLWLAGTPPENELKVKRWLPPNVRICGYVDDLVATFDSVALSVVPTRHGTGWINRLSDSLTAGVPVVGCSEPLATIPGLEIGVHALKGDTAIEFADNVIRLLLDAELRETISANARCFAVGLPTWEATVGRLEAALENTDKLPG